jgi:hypothetical protein
MFLILMALFYEIAGQLLPSEKKTSHCKQQGWGRAFCRLRQTMLFLNKLGDRVKYQKEDNKDSLLYTDIITKLMGHSIQVKWYLFDSPSKLSVLIELHKTLSFEICIEVGCWLFN